MMLEKKKISSKINYDVLRHLNSRGTGSVGGSSPSRASSDRSITATAVTQKRLNRRRKKTADTNGDLITGASIIGKR